MRKLKFILPFIIVAVLIFSAVGITAAAKSGGGEEEMLTLTLWQIDGFEGGKGSRAGYLSGVARDISKRARCYITVTSLSAEAARENLDSGTVPDLISYPAGAYGISRYITGGTPYTVWCHGGYCFLTVDQSADFSDISAQNTIINGGKDNFSGIAALFCGVDGAVTAEPTSAYVQLINNKYKYLLGTQRDIYRLITRGASFKTKPVTEFNDLYQNISVTATTQNKRNAAEAFISLLNSKSDGVLSLGLMYSGKFLHEGEMAAMERANYDYRLISPVSRETREKLESALIAKDINLIKNLIK